MPAIGYRFLPHTTDAYIEAVGSTLEQAFEFAGTALFDTMCDVQSISTRFTEEIDVNGEDEVTLLYDWLESLILKFDLEVKVYSKFDVAPVTKSRDGFRTKAMISGEEYERRKHGAKVEVKAVTYHKMEVVKDDAGTTVRFILDL